MNRSVVDRKFRPPTCLLFCSLVLLGCSVATDPVNYEDFIKAEGEGEFGIWVHSGDFNRTYFLHTPPGMDENQSYPLFVFLHGAGGTGESLHRFLDTDLVTDSAGFITVFPDGMEGSWSIGCTDCTRAAVLGIDDVAFLQTLSRHLAESLPVDTTQVYVAGFSQGGSLAHLYGCQATTPPKGVAGVASLVFRSVGTECEPAGPFPVAMVHGTFDLVSFYGGYGVEAAVQSVVETMAMWARVMGCEATPMVGDYPDTVEDFTTVTTFQFSGCAEGASVKHYRVDGGGHTWPGPTGPWSITLGSHNRDLDTTRELVSFFSSVPGGI